MRNASSFALIRLEIFSTFAPSSVSWRASYPVPTSPVDLLSYMSSVAVTESFSLNPVTPSECCKIISSLKNTKQDFNFISVKVIKEFKNLISAIFSDIVNVCFLNGVFPDIYKEAVAIPLHKKGILTCVLNFRSISLLLIFGKVMEKCFNSRLTKFTTDNAILTPLQFGFRSGLSTEHAVSKFCEYVYDSLNKKYHTINIFIDLQKAYDTINRDILLSKLELYGIRGIPLRFIASFLSMRSQRVRVDGAMSQKREIPIGLPTGSVLSCMLFLLYINDLPLISNLISPILYADDTTLSFRSPSMRDLSTTCNTELEKYTTWTEANRLSINAQKTFSIIISNRPYENPLLYINDTPIENKNCGKFLGVTIDSKLNFSKHISEVSSKIAKSIGVLYKLKSYLPTETLVTIYYSLVYPYLNYCAMIWGGTSTSLIRPLEVLQKKCVRIVCKTSYLAHTNPLFKQYNLLKFQDISKLKLAIHAYRNRENVEQFYSRSTSYNTRFNSLLLPSFQRLTTTQQSIHYRIPCIWNSIPDEIKNSSSAVRFKIKYKRFLTNSYED